LINRILAGKRTPPFAISQKRWSSNQMRNGADRGAIRRNINTYDLTGGNMWVGQLFSREETADEHGAENAHAKVDSDPTVVHAETSSPGS
jgi:hypothetical protein